RLDATLFVEAGAGSGKTRALVERIVRLVTSGTAGLDALAAITFTEKAAAELRDRVRRRLSDEHDDARAAADGERADRCRTALDDLDSAAIGTLHGFARRVLTEHPIEAGLPPRIEVLDEVGSAVAFDDRWARFLDQLLADPAVERPLLLATAAGVRVDHLRLIALAFEQNWDLAAPFAPAEPVEVRQWSETLEGLLAEIAAVGEERAHCCADDDKFLAQIGELDDWARRVGAASDEYTRLTLLSWIPGGRANGRKPNWPGYDLAGLKEHYNDLRERCMALRNDVAHAAVTRLAVDLRRFTLDAAAERRRAGELEFHDLLVLARDTLRDPVHGDAVRDALHRRYRHLLIDEFQDTDPIQIDLAVLIASPRPVVPGTAWDQVDTRAGHLFFVGDPKQSIYRFRRADISLFLRAAERFGVGGGRLSLTTNFRTGSAVIDLVNTVFAALITEQRRDGVPSQPAYEPFVAVRGDAPVGPPVTVLGAAAHEDRPRAAEVREREAADVAAAIRRAVDEGWLVDRDPHGAAPDWRPARLGDITVLVPTRTSLPALEDALTAAGISYRAESASLVYSSRLVRDLLLTLRAIDDPSDELATVAALRSPLFGCGDDDLFRFRHDHGGRFDHTRPLPAALPGGDPVGAGLTYLREQHDARRWLSPSELADRVVRDRRVLELGEAEGRARDLWRRVRFVLDQARAWTDTTNGTLRHYLAWIRQQTAEGSRVAEAVLPETDDDAVRIMTVHAAKGLEFPITIVSGLSTRPGNRRAGAEVVWPPGRPCLIRIGRTVMSDAFEAHQPIDEQMSHDERIRLLYVACTRAQDHLVISLHRATRASAPDSPSKLTSAELLADALGDRLADLPAVTATPDAPTGPTAGPQATAASPARGAARPATGPEPPIARPGTAPADVTPAAGPAPAPPGGRPTAAGTAAAGTAAGPPGATPAPGDEPPAGPSGTPPALPDLETWRRERDGALAASRVPRTVAATALTDDGRPDAVADPGLHKRPRDLDLPPWQKGRYGTAIGRAVHGVMQTIDLATGSGVAEAVAAQAAAEGVLGHEPRIRALVEAALAAPSVVAAAARPHWRELYVGVPLAGDRTLEGYVDLLYRRDDGLVVVDYKTGPAGVDDDLGPLVARYRVQGASYALAVGDATGEPVAEVVFVFLTPAGPGERSLPDLPAAVAEVRRRAAAGDAGLVVT
ncbi:MAG TPA: UvrD-helicase domain-containing protein, partial [Acidimicrobiales bacterium]|nr:UvrD-helicase domain-containing protein [Acidimicrobiales bacterium]